MEGLPPHLYEFGPSIRPQFNTLASIFVDLFSKGALVLSFQWHECTNHIDFISLKKKNQEFLAEWIYFKLVLKFDKSCRQLDIIQCRFGWWVGHKSWNSESSVPGVWLGRELTNTWNQKARNQGQECNEWTGGKLKWITRLAGQFSSLG